MKALASSGFRFFIFSNADEWAWQADPVVISIANEVFSQGHHHMIGICVENIFNLVGGGPMKKKDGSHTLVELIRAPYGIVRSGKPPKAVNTTFYVLDLQYMAGIEENFAKVPKCLVVKNVPGRDPGSMEQVLGVDSASGDVFAELLNPLFIAWPFLNFMCIKDGSSVTSMKPVPELGGKSSFQMVSESAATYAPLIEALIRGEKWAADFLHRTHYSYIEP